MTELTLKRWWLKSKPLLYTDPWALHGVNKRLVNKPFFWRGTKKEAVLFLHGWTSTPYEFRSLGKMFHKEGYTVHAPLLRGHGTIPKDLENVRWQHWMEDIEKTYRRLKVSHKRVYVVGNSLGASLALHLAKRAPDVSGLVLLGAPYSLRFERIGYYWMRFFSLFKNYKRKTYPSTRQGMEAITRVTAYNTYPIANGFQAYFAIVRSRRDLHKISQPCYIAHAENDHLAPKYGVQEIYTYISSSVKRLRHISNAYHTFIADKDKEEVRKDIVQFIKSLK